MKKLIIIITIFATIGLSPIILRLLGLIGGSMSCDFASQIIPLTIEAKKMLSSGMPFWSWNSFLGDNFIGANNFYVLGNPFTLICCLFPYEDIVVGIVLCLILQVVLYGVTSMLYFRRMGFNDSLSRLGAFMYAFSSFCIISVFYYNFAIGIILFPLLLICIEDLLVQARFATAKLAGIVAISIICNFYFAAMSLMGATMYFIVRLIFLDSQYKCRLFVKGIVSVLLGILMSSIILLPTILCTIGSERNVTCEIQTGLLQILIGAIIKSVYIFILRFSESFVELYSPFAGYALYIPFISCVFAVGYIIRNIRSWLSVLIIAYLLILLTPLNAIFSMGASVSYGRWGYILILAMTLATLYFLKTYEANTKFVQILITCIVFCLSASMLLLRYKLGCFVNQTINSLALWEAVLSVVALIGLFLIIKLKYSLNKIFIGVTIVGCVNMLIFSYLIVNKKLADVDHFINNQCERTEENTFRYRSDTSQPEHNLGYVLNRAIPNQFHSVQNKELSKFNILYRYSQNPCIRISHHHQSTDALLSVKDLIIYDGDVFPFRCDKILKKGVGYTIYQNDNYIPMGFAYDSYITESEFEQQHGNVDFKHPESGKDTGLALLQTLVISEEDSTQLGVYLKKINKINFEASLDSVVECRRKHTAIEFKGNTMGFRAKVNNESKKPLVYFFSVPKDPGFTAWMDGDKQSKIYRANLGMMGIIVPPGIHSLDVRYLTPGLKLGAILSFFGIAVCTILLFFEWKQKTVLKSKDE